ncbi:hypothetical protein EPH95_03920 [Salicibibacter halophilus]|uniref:Rpn family recombination-promoting nuclease/putative transposase n=1 Tax=Salicibibacter halophilus TaxID=2502791 RepID=A0A514LF39_9BACI|nr:hypothetical protein [Salicibibacter halophilus]QDI90433.1 hypothetical protein EPH95_03920 [Salicibibacter halophilus]
MKDETLYDAFDHWEELSSTKEQRVAYEERSKELIDQEAAEREYELREQELELRKKELELRKKEAEERGEERGEKKANEATARRLLAMGIDVETVAKGANLDVKRIIEIQQEMQ